MTLDYLDYLDIIEAESARLVGALETDRDGRIPWSERWTVGTCAKHVGGTHHVVAKIVGERPIASFALFATFETPDKADPRLPAWIATGTSSLVDELRIADPASECWSWHPDENRVAFWARRMAHETLVHRWDAEAGAGITGAAMDPAIAADGLDEYLDVFVGVSRGLQSSPAGPSIQFESTDVGTSWFLQLPEVGTRLVGHDPVECAVSLRGLAEGLLLVAWGRLTPSAAGVEIIGDAQLVQRWPELIPPM